ncbi:CHAT domain-containing protein [Actinosynnema sp. NPDC049800]
MVAQEDDGLARLVEIVAGLRAELEGTTPSAELRREALLAEAALATFHRFREDGDLDDIDEVIRLVKELCELTRPPRREPYAFVLRDTAAEKGRLTGNLDDVRDAFYGFHLDDPPFEDEALREDVLRQIAQIDQDRLTELTERAQDLHARLERHRTRRRRNAAQTADAAEVAGELAGTLAAIYSLTDVVEDAVSAVQHYRLAMDLAEPGSRVHCVAANDMAVLLRTLFYVSGDVRTVHKAVWAMEQAATALDDDDPALPSVLSNLGAVEALLHEQTGEPEYLDRAVDSSRRAFELTPADSEDLLGHRSNLGAVLLDRYHAAGDVTDLDDAIALFETSVAAAAKDRTSSDYLSRVNLGSALMARYRLTGDLGAAFRALEMQEAALEHTPRKTGFGYESALGNVGATLNELYRSTSDPGLLDRAIEALRGAAEFAPADSADLAVIHMNLAVALEAKAQRDHDTEILMEALTAIKAALDRLPPESPRYAVAVSNYGWLLSTFYEASADPAALDESVRALEFGLEGFGPDEPSRVNTLHNLVRALGSRSLLTGSPADLERAVGLVREVVDDLADLPAAIVLTMSDTFAGVAMRAGDPPLAITIYQHALGLRDRLYRTMPGRWEREVWLREAGNLPSDAAYALARHGDLRAAVLVLDRGRAMALSENLERDFADLAALAAAGHDALVAEYEEAAAAVRQVEQADLAARQGAEAFARLRDAAGRKLTSVIDRIRALPGQEGFLRVPDALPVTGADDAVVYLVAADLGGVALIARNGSVSAVWLPDLRDAVLATTVAELRSAYDARHEDRRRWFDRLDAACSWSWTAVMGPLLEVLEPVRELCLIPDGALASLPLHAAWTPGTDRPGGRRHAGDEALITYAVSDGMRRWAARTRSQTRTESVLAVESPDSDLPSATAEVNRVVGRFAEATRLAGGAATRSAVLSALTACDVAHFVCHGRSGGAEPLRGGLLMSDGILTLEDLLQLRTVRSRLAILSACETGLAGTDLPDEFLSLATGLLQTGFAGVVASQWAVPDRATTLLMAKFHACWRSECTEPAAALQVARNWLRDSTNADFADEFPDLVAVPPGLGRLGHRLWAGTRPYAHPYYWGSFFLTGV